MNSAELIKRMQQRAAARAASASAENKPENAQNAPVNQPSGWRRVVDAYAEKTAEMAVLERCAKCYFTKHPDWCYWKDTEAETEWLHHWIKTSACRSAPVRPGSGYMTLAQKDARVGLVSNQADGMIGGKEAAVAAKAVAEEDARLAALEFWARNQAALEAAGWGKDGCVDLLCRAGVELETAEIKGEYIVFNKWTRARARQEVK